MQTIAERPARVAGAISRQLATQERRAAKARQRVQKLREKASAEIERLIAFLDQTDGYSTTELEEAVDDRGCDDRELEMTLSGVHAHHVPCTINDENGELEEDREDEPSLGSVEGRADRRMGYQEQWAQGHDNDCEIDDSDYEDTCDREDVCEDEGAEHDGAEPDEDAEPSLGWTCDASAGAGTWGGCSDREADGSYVTEAARDRYKPFDRYSADDKKKMLGTEWVR